MDVDGWTKRVFEIQIPIEEVFFLMIFGGPNNFSVSGLLLFGCLGNYLPPTNQPAPEIWMQKRPFKAKISIRGGKMVESYLIDLENWELFQEDMLPYRIHEYVLYTEHWIHFKCQADKTYSYTIPRIPDRYCL